VWEIAQQAQPCRGIDQDEFVQLVTHLVETDILNRVDGVLVLGAEGEKRYGRRNFLDLYSVFETPEEVKVITTDNRVIGTLQTWFVLYLGQNEAFIFTLAGQAWQVKHLDLEHGEMVVTPAPRGAIPRWSGNGVLLSRKIAEEMRAVLLADDRYPFVTSRAQSRLDAMRLQMGELLQQGPLPLQQSGREWTLHTFAGDRINILLSRALDMILGCEATGNSFTVTIKSSTQAPLQEKDIRQALRMVSQPDFFTSARVIAMVRSLPRGRLSKFQPLLPPDLEAQFIAERLFDIEDLRHWLQQLS
jgi:ATP-dependent Lhr-like helicase